MAGKDTVTPIPIVGIGNMASNIASTIIKIQGFDNLGIQLVYTGAPVGTFTFAVSQDQVNWAVLPDALFSPAGPITATGVPDDIFVDLNQMGAAWFQMYYTATSGSGTLSALMTEKLI